MDRIVPKRPIEGVITALVTPFDDRGQLNLGMIKPLVEYNLGHGISGFFVCGSTGEGILLSPDERRALAAEVIQCNAGRGIVMVHVGTLDTATACSLAQHAEEIDADAISAIPPFYYQHSDAAVGKHFRSVAQATPLPTFIYHIPGATGHRLTADLVQECRQEPNIVGMKFSDNDLYLMRAIMDAAGPDFITLSGFDQLMLPALTMGVAGAVGNNQNIMPQMFVQTYNAFHAGHWDEAQEVFGELIRFYSVLKRYDTSKTTKRVLRMIGLDCGPPRPPNEWISDEDDRLLHEDLRAAGFLKMHGIADEP